MEENFKRLVLEQGSQLFRYFDAEGGGVRTSTNASESFTQANGSRLFPREKAQSKPPVVVECANNLEDILNCVICMGRLRNAQMCPHCSKMCCEACIRSWLDQKSECPHCRAPLRASKLVQCRFVSDISSAIDSLRVHETKEERCREHDDNVMQYFCKDCQTAICSDCAMFGTQHKQHSFEKIQKVYDVHYGLVKREMDVLAARIDDLVEQREKVEQVIEFIGKQKRERQDELASYFEQMTQRIEQDQKTHFMTFLQMKNQLSEEIYYYEQTREELDTQIGTASRSTVIKECEQMVRKIQEINCKPLLKLSQKHALERKDFILSIVPEYANSVFVIENFKKRLRNKEEDVLYSQPLFTHGIQWRLKVYPNGNGQAKNAYISVFLEMTEGHKDSQKYEYRVEMINQRSPTVQITREFSSEFEAGECWGYNRFFRIEQLESEGYLNPDEDRIVLKFYVRSPNFNQQARDQKRYITLLESDKQSLCDKLAEQSRIIQQLNEQLKKRSFSSSSDIPESGVKQHTNKVEIESIKENKSELANQALSSANLNNRLEESENDTKIYNESHSMVLGHDIDNVLRSIRIDEQLESARPASSQSQRSPKNQEPTENARQQQEQLKILQQQASNNNVSEPLLNTLPVQQKAVQIRHNLKDPHINAQQSNQSQHFILKEKLENEHSVSNRNDSVLQKGGSDSESVQGRNDERIDENDFIDHRDDDDNGEDEEEEEDDEDDDDDIKEDELLKLMDQFKRQHSQDSEEDEEEGQQIEGAELTIPEDYQESKQPLDERIKRLREAQSSSSSDEYKKLSQRKAKLLELIQPKQQTTTSITDLFKQKFDTNASNVNSSVSSKNVSYSVMAANTRNSVNNNLQKTEKNQLSTEELCGYVKPIEPDDFFDQPSTSLNISRQNVFQVVQQVPFVDFDKDADDSFEQVQKVKKNLLGEFDIEATKKRIEVFSSENEKNKPDLLQESRRQRHLHEKNIFTLNFSDNMQKKLNQLKIADLINKKKQLIKAEEQLQNDQNKQL